MTTAAPSLFKSLARAISGQKDLAATETHLHLEPGRLIENAVKILQQSPTGQILVRHVLRQGTQVYLVKGEARSFYKPDTREVFVGLPANQSHSLARITLLLAGALREAEQVQLGVIVDNLNASAGERLAVGAAKEADKVMYMCAIAHELNQLKTFTEYNFLDELRALGHSESLDLYLGSL